ncbi:protein transport protein Sec16A isoform X9 [Gallus gallus]|uniref:protein transport protein Sec16A isoform X9 n=1 Tax=Gallus gallus TaxID=9031 RepID=UPI0003507161|nr:protein transport protein Sec16A isoform X9 [Gallus gallus]|eukprot:XP_004946034.1 protein transport protein Sec16A isoform X8 [Gallus gallus]
MQQPPQTVPAGAAAPPPAGIARNTYWRSTSLSKRANATAAPVQPVTDPFAFGRQTPQGSPLDNPSKGNALVMQSSSPAVFPQPGVVHASPSHAGDNPHGLHPSLSAPVSQPGINSSTFSNVPIPAPSPGYVTNSTTEVHPNADLGLHGSAVPSHYNAGTALENSFSVHPGMVSMSNNPGGKQDVNRDLSDVPSGPAAAALFPPAPQQPMSQWRPVQGTLQPPVRNFVPYPEPPSQTDIHNISQSSVSTSHPPPQTHLQHGPVHQGIPQNAAQAPLSVGCEKNGKNGSANSGHHMNSIQPGNVFRQNTEMTNAWLNQPYQEQFYPQPLLQDSSSVIPTAQENNLQKQSPGMSETSNRPIPTDQDSGSLSMFFKGDEAENEEILSSEKNYMVEKTEFACQPHSSPLYHQPMHPQRVPANVLSQAQIGTGSANEMIQKGMDVQYFPKILSQQEAQAAKQSMFVSDGKAGVGDAPGNGGSQYENVENLECIQNQEVLPSEPRNMNASSPAAHPDLYRYGSLPGQMLPKNAVVSHAEGGPNLEAPDSLAHPVRPDSVSSNYSNISHRSASSSARAQEQIGTFIQQESGKPDEESSARFFKQIDSSPLGDDSSEINPNKSYHGNLSQPPTPSPPKPTGVFQTSANSSFEPVRSHGVGIKPAEIDQAKMVVELRENHPNQKNTKKSTAMPAASPGNLEQPPDNLETIFMPQVYPLPLAVTGEAGNMLHSGPVTENMQSLSERRSSTRAQGAIKKCDSPATTLWAHNELPNFGGNVLLAPAAPAVYVPAKQTVEVIQPPEEGLSNQQPNKPGSIAVQPSQDGNISSENLENPPKMGEEEALQSQVTKDVQHQAVPDRAVQGALPSQPQMQAAQLPASAGQSSASSNYQTAAGTKGTQMSQQCDNQEPRNQEASSAQLQSPDKQPASGQPSGAVAPTATTTSQPVLPSAQQDLQRPPLPQTPQDAFGPPQNPYYYYRHPYDAYQPPYPPPYPPPDPRTAAHLYYLEDSYGQYDPRYRYYDSSSTAYMEPGSYRYSEPERPSSRASHCSDRPSSRQGYPEDYYAKTGWTDYYPGYYPSTYDYGDPSRWERYSSAYDPRYRDPRSYDQRYMYDGEHNPYQKREAYPYGNRHDRYDDRWRYDPRFTGSFDDDAEPHRDPYGDEFDRRSVHSEHSGHSLRSSHSVHSHRSSFSSRSQQSQLYRSNHDLTANAYETTAQAVSLHTDYPYGGYAPNFDGQQPFTDYGYSTETGWSAVDQVPLRPSTPEKFSVPHLCARFGPGGFLIKVLPNLPSEGQPALVEIHSMETMLQHSPEQEEMRAFPGPLAKDDTHKVDVINFAQNKATQCFKNENLIDKESASLLWDFIVLLCRQNGTVVGTDLAELLLRDHKTVWLPGKSPNEANLIDFTNEALEQVEEESGEAQLSFLTDSLITTIDSLEKETERFRELLLYGRKKDALESAMKHGLWGHALLLASKMDNRTHARVMTRFANSLPINDPLQTVYQLMSGRMPAASTCCGDEKWGDWRPHLAMVLSNLTNNVDLESRTIATMGDTLASKGLLDAAHFCYLMAQVGFGVYTRKTTKLVLIGSNHSLPFLKFATNEAIQRTEAYEYAQSLGTQPGCLPNFQVFKFIYACRLAEMGLAAQAFHYCEVISRTVLKDPQYYSPVLIGQLIQMSSQLRLFDPQIKEKPDQESFIEPSWLVRLRHVDGQIKEGAIAYSTDRSTPQQYPCSTPSSELDHTSQYDGAGVGHDMVPGAENALLASLLPNMAQQMQSVQLMPSAPQAILDGSTAGIPPSDQEAVQSVPFYPVAPQPIGPGPGFAPPGFSNQYGAEPSPLYLGSTLPPGGPPQETEPREEEQTKLETGMQRIASESPSRNSFPEQREEDFYSRMARMAPERRSRSASQSSAYMGYGQRSRTTSESSAHSVGRERSNSAAKQPPPSPPVPVGKETKKEVKKEPASRKTGANWFRWLMGKGKNEAHLPDDKNKSIVWDEKKQRWVNLDEPEEESKPPPPPPTGFPKVPQAAPSGPGGPPSAPVNMFSRRAAGSRARYVDVLNPGGTKSSGAVPAPSDLFAPLAPMPIPANVFVPNAVPGDPQPMEGSGAAEHTPAANQTNTDPSAAVDQEYLNPAIVPPGSGLPVSSPDSFQPGELSRSSSMSSLSREVSQHFNQPAPVPPSGEPSAGTVQFYNPSQFAQSPAVTGSSRPGRIGQRKYPTLK